MPTTDIASIAETADTPLRPNRTDINRHLYGLAPPEFAKDYPKAWIEIAYADPTNGGELNAAEHFSVFQLADAAEFAAKKNAAGFNVYVGVALRQGETGPSGRASGTNFLAVCCSWAEFDRPGDDTRINAVLKEKNLLTTMTVVTGRTPNLRAHLYFRIKECTTKENVSAANEALETLLGSDNVKDACRVMRLAGTINYPTKDKRERGYVTELTALHIRKDAPTYTVEQLIVLVPGPVPEPEPESGESNFWRKVNDMAFANLGAWVPALFPSAKYQPGTGAYRISSEDLGRNLEEDLSISPNGAKDFGVHDIGDPRKGKRTAVAIVVEHGGAPDAKAAALWLCKLCNVDPASLGWKAPEPPPPPATGDSNPVDLWGYFEPPKLPQGLLPKSIESYAFAQARTMGVDPGGLAMAALAVCAAAIPDRIKLTMKSGDDWGEAARLWVGLVGMPSTKKTPIIRAAAKPLIRLDGILFRKFLADMEEYKQLEPEERKAEPKPVQRRHRLEDATVESAQEVLAGSPDGVLMLQDELSSFFGAMDKYSGHRGAAKDRGFWLQSYNGGEYSFNRINRGCGLIPNLSVSLLGGIQPDVIRKLSSDSHDDGFLQRMLLIMMGPATLGQNAASPSVLKDYAELIERLTKLQTPVSGSWNDDNDGVLRFDNRAQDIRGGLEAKHLCLAQTVETINRKLAAHIGKYDGLFGRLCVAFHCIEHAVDPIDREATAKVYGTPQRGNYIPEFVTGDTADRVAKFMHQFLLPHAFAFYSGVLKLADDHDRLVNVAGYILTHPEKRRLTNRDVPNHARSRAARHRGDLRATGGFGLGDHDLRPAPG
jgi:Protein of unknown function (DUF3987)